MTINPGLYRKKVREVLALAPGRRFTEEMILDAINLLLPEPLSIESLRTHMEWNQSKGFIDYFWNGEAERKEWSLTNQGKAQE